MRILAHALLAVIFSAPALAGGLRAVPIFSHWAPAPGGVGRLLVGEISELRDLDTAELVGYVFHRNFRSYYIDLNEGQPHIEAWDFPLHCASDFSPSERECSDSRLARVTIVPYLDDKFLGPLQITIDREKNLFRASVNDRPFLEVEWQGMTITNGVVREDLSQAPEELTDPAVFCAPGISCVRAVAFGRLAHDEPRRSDKALVITRGGPSKTVDSLKVFQSRTTPSTSPHRFKTEQELLRGLGLYY